MKRTARKKKRVGELVDDARRALLKLSHLRRRRLFEELMPVLADDFFDFEELPLPELHLEELPDIEFELPAWEFELDNG